MEVNGVKDEELVRLTLEGDDGAFRQLHDRYVSRVFQYAFTQTGDYYHAEEVTQDIMYKMTSRLASFKQKSSFKTWLFTIGRHVIIDHYRKYKKHKDTVSMTNEQVDAFQEPAASVESEVMHNLLSQELVDGLNQLPVYYRTVLHLRFIEGFSIADTATVMSKTVMSIKALQVKAKKQLADLIGNEVNDHHGS